MIPPRQVRHRRRRNKKCPFLTRLGMQPIIHEMPSVTAKRRKPKRKVTRQTLEQAGPSNAKLKHLAKTRRPPQRWYDETDNPLKPSRSK